RTAVRIGQAPRRRTPQTANRNPALADRLARAGRVLCSGRPGGGRGVAHRSARGGPPPRAVCSRHSFLEISQRTLAARTLYLDKRERIRGRIVLLRNGILI